MEENGLGPFQRIVLTTDWQTEYIYVTVHSTCKTSIGYPRHKTSERQQLRYLPSLTNVSESYCLCHYLEFSFKIWRSVYGADSDVCSSNPHNGHIDTTVFNGSQRISKTKTVGQRLCSWITLRITAEKSVCLSIASRDLWKYCLMYAQDFTYSLQKGWNVCGGSGRRAEQHGRRNPVTEGTCPLLGDAIDKSGQVNRKPIQVECMSSVQ